MQIFVKTFEGKTLTFEVNKHMYVEELRKRVGARINVPYANVRLRLGSKQLRVDMRLCCQSVLKEHTLQLSYYHFPGGYTCESEPEGSSEQILVNVYTRTGVVRLSKMADCTDTCILYRLNLLPYFEVEKNCNLKARRYILQASLQGVRARQQMARQTRTSPCRSGFATFSAYSHGPRMEEKTI